MIELSFPGLIGAFLGTAMAAWAYAPLVRAIERRFRQSASPASEQERKTLDQETSLLRRAVLALDIAFFAGLGYWLAVMLAA
jgi:hypothetical protein